MYETSENMVGKEKGIGNKRRVSSQPLLPQQVQAGATASEGYVMYPFHALGADKIFTGYDSLAQWMTGHQQIIIDGYGGIFWKEVQHCLQAAFEAKGVQVHWIDVSTCMKKEEVVDKMVAPFLGTEESVWGTRCNFRLSDFFNMNELLSLQAGK